MKGTATATALRALEILAARDPAGLEPLLAAGAVMDFPYAPVGFVERLEGRAAVIEGLGVVPRFFREFAITPRRTYETPEGDVVIEAEGTAMLQDGTPYRNAYVMIFEIRDGAIARWSEYNNPLQLPGMGG